MRGIALQLIILDEVNAASGQFQGQRWGLGQRQADAWLDDRTDQQSVLDAAEASRTLYSEGRTGIDMPEGVGEFDVQETQGGYFGQFEQVAGNSRQRVGKRRPHVVERPRQTDAPARVAQ